MTTGSEDGPVTETSPAPAADWVAAAKKQQAHEADHLAAVASGIGEYGIANACYRLAFILRQHAAGDYSSMLEDYLAEGSGS